MNISELEQSFWEKYLRAIGIVKGNVSSYDLHKLCTNNPKDTFKSMVDLRATIMAYARDKAPAAAFFAKDGTPLSLGEMCERTKTHVEQIRQMIKNRTPGALWFLSKLIDYKIAMQFVGSTSKMIEEIFVNRRGGEAAKAAGHSLYIGALLTLFLSIDDGIDNNSLRNNINATIEIESFRVDKLLQRVVRSAHSSRIHLDIRNACQSNSVADLRALVLEKHPHIAARFLVHPDGRLLSSTEICIMLSEDRGK